MELIHISYAGPEVLILDRKGRKWRFEDHRFCGPIVLNKHGDPLDTQPPQSSPFWEAVNCWYQQGKRTKQVAGSEYAEWTRPTMEKMIHVGGNHFILETSAGIAPDTPETET